MAALQHRPEILALQDQVEAAEKLGHAEQNLWRPTVSGLGTVGVTPVRNENLPKWHSAVGVNVNIPVFNGFLYNARAKTADLQTDIAKPKLMEQGNNIARAVRTSWPDSQRAFG